jgi:hypothetical protein
MDLKNLNYFYCLSKMRSNNMNHNDNLIDKNNNFSDTYSFLEGG